MPIYEYRCEACGNIFEQIEPVSKASWKSSRLKKVYCVRCGKKEAVKAPTAFKIGIKILETTGKSGYETDAFTLGKLIDEGGIPYEEKARLRDRDKMIKRQIKYTKELSRRAKAYNFDPGE